MRVLVVGAGGVGGYFGARLARAGVSVTFLARGAHLEAIQRHGLRVRSSAEGEWTVKVDATGDAQRLAPADVVLFCVKSFDTQTAAEAIAPAIGPETAVVSLQNGVDNEEALGHVLGPGHAVGGVAWVFAAIESPGVIVHRLGGRLAFGELDGRPSPRLESLQATFASAGVAAEVSKDITRVLWEKYLLIGAQAGMTALTRAPIGVIRSTAETWLMYRRLVEELAALGLASGVRLAPDVVDSIVRDAGALAPTEFSSLHTDLTQGRRLELEALHGHALRLGQRLGVATPMLFAVYAALRPHAEGATTRGAPE
ncbi:MAG TPA: 2-dehydropantoate 2-reductase [Patescibacteria group bacterium]|nr:2-dehydropantoate 2-reductase [Patescibacteria group bacterium]